MNTIWSSIILGGVGLIITTAYYVLTFRRESDRLRKELFLDCNRRYDELNEHLHEIVKLKSIEDLNIRDAEVRKYYNQETRDFQNIRYYRDVLDDFFNLCAEEHYWHCRKRLGDKIWWSWEKGMNDWYKHPIIQQAWKKEADPSDSRGPYVAYYLKKDETFFKKR